MIKLSIFKTPNRSVGRGDVVGVGVLAAVVVAALRLFLSLPLRIWRSAFILRSRDVVGTGVVGDVSGKWLGRAVLSFLL